MSLAYKVKLDGFEGPLDLLLHLINQYEIDIYDIPVAEITEQYMDFIHTMQHLELNIASEYLVMAATLIAIKSEMLLPKPDLSDEEMEDYMEDPREELVTRLVEYRKYKQAAGNLKDKEMEAQQIFTRSSQKFVDDGTDTPKVQGEVSIYDMLSALGKVIQRMKWNQPLATKVQRVEIPIEERMDQVLNRLKNAKNGILFEDMFPYQTKSHVVVTFMAILELMNNNQVYCEQTKHFGELLVYVI